MTILFTALITAVLANLLLGLVVFLRSPKKSSSRWFSLVVFISSLWMIANYFVQVGTVSLLVNQTANSFAYPLGALSIFSIYLFSVSFYDKSENKNVQNIVTIFTAILVPLSYTDYVAGTVLRENGDFIFSSGFLLPAYSVGLLLLLGVTVRRFAKIIRDKTVSQATKTQSKLMVFGFTISILGGIIASTLLPYFTGDYGTARLGPMFMVFFVGFTSYAIIKHKLFDIKLAVARTIGYFLSVLSVALLFASSAFLAINFLTDDELKVTAEQQVLFTIVAVVLAFVFQPVKNFFDKLSNSIFYRDAYDPQEFLDELNKVLVTKVDVEPLLNETVGVIKSHLKSEFCAFSIRKTQYMENRLIGDDKSIEAKELETIGKLTSHIHTSVIVADELEVDNEELKDLLQKNDIAAVARLVTTVEYDVEGVGYLMLGVKRNGSPYGRQDIKMVEIIANELVIAIQNALRFEEIEEFNVTLQEKIDEATKKLRHTNKKLEEMDETKDEFISMASHQLRTPLTSVKGYLSMVLEGDAGEIKPMQERLLSQAYTSSQRMVYLIADLLNVSRLRTGKFVIEPIRTNLATIVEGEVSQLKETAASRKLELVYEKPQKFPDLMLDETKVRQVVMNFIDNAIYYTPAGGTITVELKDKKDAIEYTVTDTGMGVPKIDQQHLFTKFYRAGNARKARPDGTGLGLFMAKKVIIEQGGAVIFKSKEGEGSTFGFTFPKDKLTPKETVKKDTDKSA